jgi:hypothetical protein
MNSYKVGKIIELNNGAVKALQQGRHKEAIVLLRAAVADLVDNFVVHKHASCFSSEAIETVSTVEMQFDSPSSSSSLTSLSFNDEDFDDHSSVSEFAFKQDKPSISSVPLWTEDSFAQSQSQDETLIFMYDRALVLAHTKHCRELIMGVVLFNMALVNHARGIKRGITNLVSTALNIYSMATGFIQRYDEQVNASDQWILLALYNNMAQIYLSQARCEELRKCLSNIQTLLAEEITVDVVDDYDYAFFFTNSMLQLGDFVAAPAA